MPHFTIAEVTGLNALNTFEVAMEEDFTAVADVIDFINAGMEEIDFSFTATETGVIWSSGEAPAATPEPATLVMLGLGLAGLGWARR